MLHRPLSTLYQVYDVLSSSILIDPPVPHSAATTQITAASSAQPHTFTALPRIYSKQCPVDPVDPNPCIYRVLNIRQRHYLNRKLQWPSSSPFCWQPWQQWLVPRKLNPIRQPRRGQQPQSSRRHQQCYPQYRAKRVSTPHPFMNDLLTVRSQSLTSSTDPKTG